MAGLTTRFPAARCPWCGKKIDAISHMTEAVAPKPGDITLCLGCSGTMIVGDDGIPRMPRKAELETMFFEQPDLVAETGKIKRSLDAMYRVFPEAKRKMRGSRR